MAEDVYPAMLYMHIVGVIDAPDKRAAQDGARGFDVMQAAEAGHAVYAARPGATAFVLRLDEGFHFSAAGGHFKQFAGAVGSWAGFCPDG